jgi:large subunit ribosomal protein L6
MEQQNGEVIVTRNSDYRTHRAKHGLTRSLLNSMVVGVSQGFKKDLRIEGVGYRAALDGKKLVLNLGYSHPVIFDPPEGISFEVDKSGRDLAVLGFDKELVGEIAARIRRQRPPEPYKGKGVRYVGERVRRKAGKAGKAK